MDELSLSARLGCLAGFSGVFEGFEGCFSGGKSPDEMGLGAGLE